MRRRWDPKSRVWGADQLILALDLYRRSVPCCMVTGKQRSAWGRDVETALTLLQTSERLGSEEESKAWRVSGSAVSGKFCTRGCFTQTGAFNKGLKG